MSFRQNWTIKHSDPCLGLFGESMAAAGFDIPAYSRVLEIGCSEADWRTPALRAEPTLEYTGIDWRKNHRHASPAERDILQVVYQPASFDWIVAISTIEHVGLGHYDHDPKDEAGDTKTMQRIVGWLKPGGSVYFDVPYTPAGYRFLHGDKARLYDDAAIRSRLMVPGLTLRWTGYAPKNPCCPLIPKPTDDDPARKGFLYYVAFWLTKGVGMDQTNAP